MSDQRSGWQIGLSEFKAADRDYRPVTDVELARVVLPFAGCKLDWEEDAANGVYAATLSEELHTKLLAEGHAEVEFIDRMQGAFKITVEADLDKI